MLRISMHALSRMERIHLSGRVISMGRVALIQNVMTFPMPNLTVHSKRLALIRRWLHPHKKIRHSKQCRAGTLAPRKEFRMHSRTYARASQADSEQVK